MNYQSPGQWAVVPMSDNQGQEFFVPIDSDFLSLLIVVDSTSQPIAAVRDKRAAQLMAMAPAMHAALQRLIASDDAHATLHADDGDDITRMIEYGEAWANAREVMDKVGKPEEVLFLLDQSIAAPQIEWDKWCEKRGIDPKVKGRSK